MAKIADAERFPGNAYWTVYDGKGGVFHAQRDKSTRTWRGWQQNGIQCFHGKTLRHLRERIANESLERLQFGKGV